MMSNQWTDAQRHAINSRNGSVLVSAAAGAGKTTVLVERVMQRVIDEKHPTNIENILVVTYTKAAASEMLEKITAKLNELIKKNPKDSNLKRQKMFLPSANICTIDSFCNKIVKDNCQLLDIAPDFTMLESNDLMLLQREVLSEVLEELYVEDSEESNALLDLFANGKNDNELINSIFSVYGFSTSSVYPEKWIKEQFAHYFKDIPVEQTIWGQYCLARVKAIAEYVLTKCDKLLIDAGDTVVGRKTEENISGAVSGLKRVLELIDSGNNWDEIKLIVDSLKMTGDYKKGIKKDDKDEHYYDIYKRAIALKNDFSSLAEIMTCTAAEFKEDIQMLRPAMAAFEKCVLAFSSRFFEAKQNKNAYDYHDILHMALKLCAKETTNGEYKQTPIALELSEKFDEILIDEFQDTNEAQDTLFNMISKDSSNLFMVGDIKQSVYQFRQAMPEIFMKYRDGYEIYDEEVDNYPSKILLDRNFRSRKGIVDGVNFFFDYLMTRKMGDIDYKKGEGLVAAAKYSETDNKDVHVHIVKGRKQKGSNLSDELLHVGKIINELVASGMTVGNEGKERPITYGDICILVRKLAGKGETIARELSAMGVPIHYEKNKGFFDNAEIVTIISILKIIDNPVQDVPLLSVMLSPMFPFDEDDITQMRCQNRKGSIYDLLKENYETNEKVKYFLDVVYQLRMLSVTLGVGELIRRIFEITSYDSIVGAMKNGEKHVLNLQLLIEYAENFEANGGHGLSGFIRYVDKLRKSTVDLNKASTSNKNDDSVILSTIHSSKGLEYPVVFLVDCSDTFGHANRSKIIIDRTMGIGTYCYDSKRNLEYKTQIFDTVSMKNKLQELNEEVRIYYVAMTRAREKLYIVGSAYKPKDRINEIYSRFYVGNDDNSVSLSLSNTFLDWAILTMLQHPSTYELRKELNILCVETRTTNSKIDLQVIDTPELLEEALPEEVEKTPFDVELLETIKDKVHYEYPYADFAAMPVKYSASSVGKDNQVLYIATENPSFMGKDELTPAQRGTLVHRFMEKCDLALAKVSVDDEIARLKNKGIFTETEAKAINSSVIAKFFESDMYKRIEKAQQFVREKEFTMAVPMSFVKKDLQDAVASEGVVVQGIMDGLIINGKNGEIIDYKTDKVTNEEELRSLYTEQMRVYKMAAEKCFGLENVKVTLYSFGLSKEISLKLEKNT